MKYYTIVKGNNCPWCDKARQLLYDKGEDYVNVVNASEEPWVKRLMLMSGLSTVPQVFTPYGELVGGYKELEVYLKGKEG